MNYLVHDLQPTGKSHLHLPTQFAYKYLDACKIFPPNSVCISSANEF